MGTTRNDTADRWIDRLVKLPKDASAFVPQPHKPARKPGLSAASDAMLKAARSRLGGGR